MKFGILSFAAIAAIAAFFCATACKQQESVSTQKGINGAPSRTISFVFGPIVRSVSY